MPQSISSIALGLQGADGIPSQKPSGFSPCGVVTRNPEPDVKPDNSPLQKYLVYLRLPHAMTGESLGVIEANTRTGAVEAARARYAGQDVYLLTIPTDPLPFWDGEDVDAAESEAGQ